MKKNINKAFLFNLFNTNLVKENFISYNSFLLICDAPDFWQLRLQDPSSSIMEGILLFNKHLLFITIVIVILTIGFFFNSVLVPKLLSWRDFVFFSQVEGHIHAIKEKVSKKKKSRRGELIIADVVVMDNPSVFFENVIPGTNFLIDKPSYPAYKYNVETGQLESSGRYYSSGTPKVYAVLRKQSRMTYKATAAVYTPIGQSLNNYVDNGYVAELTFR